MRSKRYALFVLIAGIATFASLILMIALSGGEIARPAEYPNKVGFSQAIFFFEMARSPEEIKSALGEPSTETGIRLRHAMDMTNRLDYIFLVCYPLLLIALILFLRSRLDDTGQKPPLVTTLTAAGICLSIIVIFADAYENQQLLKLTAYADLSRIDPAVITKLIVSTNIKSGAITAAGLIIIYFYVLIFKKSPGILIPLLYAVSAVLGITALTASSRRALIETAASLNMIGWLVSTIHGGYVFWRSR
ncbi:MAG: hypothetical protein KA369_22675 [Spirochaetes bacterium]|nr:hypothetical protein [Spirochaetota bacterium]